jgi:hypothetical protein
LIVPGVPPGFFAVSGVRSGTGCAFVIPRTRRHHKYPVRAAPRHPAIASRPRTELRTRSPIFTHFRLAYLCVQHGVKRFGLIVQVLTAAGSLIQIHLLEPLKEEKCLCADKFGHIEGGGFLSGHW